VGGGVCVGDVDDDDGDDGDDGGGFCVAGGTVGCCARAEYPATKAIARPTPTFNKGLGDWRWPTRVAQLKRFITSCRLSSEFY
jgi:hypothetical protein